MILLVEARMSVGGRPWRRRRRSIFRIVRRCLVRRKVIRRKMGRGVGGVGATDGMTREEE